MEKIYKSKRHFIGLMTVIIWFVCLSNSISSSFAQMGCNPVNITFGGHVIEFLGVTYDSSGVEPTSTWTYKITASNNPPEISHVVFGNLSCASCFSNASHVISASHPYSVEVQPPTNYCGIKFDFSFSEGEVRIYSFTMKGAWAIGEITFVAKAATGYTTAKVCGPVCSPPVTCPPEMVWNTTSGTCVPLINAVNDYGSFESNTNGTVLNVLSNDFLNGITPTAAKVNIGIITDFPSTPSGGVSLNTSTGNVSVQPNTTPGNYSMTYSICDVGNPSRCDTAIVSLFSCPASSNSTTTTYQLGDLPTDRSFTTLVGVSSSACPGQLKVTIPTGAYITGVDVEYKIEAINPGRMSHQRSHLRCVSQGGVSEATLFSGSGNSAGIMSYSRSNLAIANDVFGGGDIYFELHAGRTSGGSGCNSTYNKINNNSWKVTVHYLVPDFESEINNSEVIDNDSIASTVINYGSRTNVFDVKIVDKDICDGLPTIIKELVFTQGDNNEFANWTQFIAGASLFGPDLGENSGLELTGIVTNDRITFSGTDIISVANFDSSVYYLRIWLNPGLTTIHDNKKFHFELKTENIVTSITEKTSGFGNSTCESSLVALYFKRDENSALTEGDNLEPNSFLSLNNSFATRISAMDFKLIDMGTSDQAHTIIDKIIFRQGPTNEILDWREVIDGVTLFGPDLGEESGSEIFGIVDSNFIRFNLSDMITIEDGTSEVYYLRIWLNPDMPNHNDNKIIDFELDYTDITTSNKFSSRFGIGYVSSESMLIFPRDSKTIVAMNDSITPAIISSEIASETDRMTVFYLNFADAGEDGFSTLINGIILTQGVDNEIIDWSSIISGATLYGPDLGGDTCSELLGIIDNDSIIFIKPCEDKSLCFENFISVDDSTSENYELKIWLTDSIYDCNLLQFELNSSNISVDTLGSRFDTTSAQSQDILVIFEKDNEVEILESYSTLSDSISSVINTQIERQTVLDFLVADKGTDRFNSTIDKILITQGDNNKVADWTSIIAGATLYGPDLGQISGAEINGTIYSDNIEFDAPGMINVLEGDTELYQLRIWLLSDLAAINDNDTIDFKLSFENINTAFCNSSAMDTSIVQSGPIIIDIEATKLIFMIEEPPTYVEAGEEFKITVYAVDENNNVDRDADYDFRLELEDGNGNLSSDDGFDKTLTDGSYTWTDVTYDEKEDFTLKVVSEQLSQGATETVSCLDEYAVVSEGIHSEPDFISSVINDESERIMVFNFTLTDKGIADSLPTLINELIIRQGRFNEVLDWTQVIAGVSLYGPDLGEVSGNEIFGVVESDSIVFSDSIFINIADSTEEVYMLKIWLLNDLSNINHNDLISFSLDYSDITVADSGSTFFGNGFTESNGIRTYIEPQKLVFEVNAPPAVVGYDSEFTVTVRVMDDNNNYNTTDTSIVLLSKVFGNGSIESDTGLTQTLVNGTYTWTDIKYNDLGYFGIQATAPGLTAAVSDSIVSVIDLDSEISYGPSSSPDSISSLNNVYSKRVIVLDVMFTDKGTDDNLPTIIDSLFFTQGLMNEIPDWRKAIEGATLYGPDLGLNSGMELLGVIDSTTISFSGSEIININDGANEVYKLKIWLYYDLSGIIDNDSIDIKLDYSDISTPVLGTSYFGEGEVSTGGMAVDIDATKLAFISNQPPTIVGFSYDFVVGVQAVDINGNRDIDANDDITLSLYQGTGSLITPPAYGFTQQLDSGVYMWYEMQYDEEEPFRMRVVSNTLSQALSSVILCKKCVKSAMYNLGDISTFRDYMSSGDSDCPGVLSIFVPSFAIVVGVDVFYTMTTGSTGLKSQQRSQLRCVSPGGLSEAVIYEGSGDRGSQQYERFNLSIANDVQPGADYVFELHAGRTEGGTGCGTEYNKVDNYTWTVFINYVITNVYWTGDVSTDWHDPFNWACELVPNQYLDVIIPGDVDNMPFIENGNAETRTLFIEDGATVTLDSNIQISIYGDLNVEGGFDVLTNQARVNFMGDGSSSSGRQIVNGTDNFNFFDVYVENTSYVKLLKDVNITGDIIVNGTLESTLSNTINMNGESNVFVLENNSVFIPKFGTVEFSGSGRQMVLSSENSFYNIVLNTDNKDNQLVLWDNLTVENEIELTKGVLNLNNNQLIIDNASVEAIKRDSLSSGYINAESVNNSDFSSSVRWNIGDNVNTYSVPFAKDTITLVPMSIELTRNFMSDDGYITFSTYSTGTDNNPKPEIVAHLGDPDEQESATDLIVDRFWFFDSNDPSKENISNFVEGYISMSFLESELDYVLEESMAAQRYNSDLNIWADIIYSQNDFDDPIIRGFSSVEPVQDNLAGKFKTSYVDSAQFYNVWVLSDKDNPLPIKLLRFEALCINDVVDINWVTASEINNHFFTLEKSYDGYNWDLVATVSASGNSSTDRFYNYVDDEASQIVSYYRLKQTDYNGISETFKPVVVIPCLQNHNDFEIYPNPFSNIINIYLFNLEDSYAEIKIYDAVGRLVNSNIFKEIEDGQGKVSLNLNSLSNGVYYMTCISGDYVRNEIIIKQN
ncbi:MAG: T9SS type A sorting domain-containing protein [Bacteroidales bacterium]|nr:T9SS type A sorting domain-containing protein [Bacteroidales bacterium]